MPVHFVSFPKTDAVKLLGGLFSQAHCVEIAVGYFRGSGLQLLRPQIKEFLKNSQHTLRVLVADSYEQTEGEAVQELLTLCKDCIRFFDPASESETASPPQPGGIFHPKAFCFHLPHGRSALLGSANFSSKAWEQNTEWSYLLEEDANTAASLDDLSATFNRSWEAASPISEEALRRFIIEQKEYLIMKDGKVTVPQWNVNDIVRHKTQPAWGLGQVRYVGGNQVIVQFDGGTIKEIAAVNLIAAQGPLQMLGTLLCGETTSSPERYDLRTQARFLQLVHGNTGALSRARVDILPHQMLAAHRVVSSDPPRWLVADDVGLGKTIEAGLMIAALRSKEQAQRVLIVVPAGLRQQWQDELREKFNMNDFALFSSAMMKQYGSDTTQVWKQMNRLIASIDTLAQSQICETLEGSQWDLVIFDEAHKLSAYDGYYSKRFNLARFLRDHATVKASVYLTATPHQGIHSKFWHLANLVRPDLLTHENQWELEKSRLSELMMRSRKRQVTDMEGKALFPDPPRTVQIRVKLTEPELKFYAALHTYLRTGYLTAEKARTSGTKSRAIGFAMTTFQKLASSSPYAIRDALLNRLAVLSPRSTLLRTHTRDSAGKYLHGAGLHAADDDADIRTKEENLPNAEELGYSKEFFAEEKTQLTRLIKLLNDITSAGAKWKAFEKTVSGCLKQDPTANILIFTEYRRTQNFLAERLGNKYGKAKIALIHGGMDLSERMKNAALFNRQEAQFLVSTEAGGEGINLQDECHILINYDLPWNPMRLYQRIGRLDRYGQKNPVQIFQFYQVGEITVSEGRATRTVPLVDDRVQEILKTKIQEVVDTIGKLNPGEEPENIRDYLLGELAEARNFSIAKIFQTAVVKEDTKAAEQLLTQALKTIDNAKSAFATDLAGVPGFALGDYEAIRPEAGMDEVQKFSTAFFSLYKAKREDAGEETFHLKLPDKMRFNTKVKPFYERLTFNRKRAARDNALDLLAFGHEVFDMMIAHSLEPEFGGAAAIRSVTAPDKKWKGRCGVEFHFIITLNHQDNQPAREKWVSVFVDEDGKVQPEIARQIVALPSHIPKTKASSGTKSTPADWNCLAEPWLSQAYENAKAEADKKRVELSDELKALHAEGAVPTLTLDLFAASATQFI